MTRRGVALLTVLWVLTVLSATAASALALARLGSDTSRNRIVLLRGAWARDACEEILLARYPERRAIVDLDSVYMGRGTWCRILVEDPAAKLDLNHLPFELLRSLLGGDSLADALLDWRDADEVPRPAGAEAGWYRARHRRPPRNGPFASVRELIFVRGFDRSRVARLDSFLTARGALQVDVNAAPPAVLAVLPGLGPEAVAQVLRRRAAGRPIISTDELLTLLSPSARQAWASRHQEYGALAAYSPSRLVVRVEGGVRGARPVAAARVTMVPLPSRLVVLRREVE